MYESSLKLITKPKLTIVLQITYKQTKDFMKYILNLIGNKVQNNKTNIHITRMINTNGFIYI